MKRLLCTLVCFFALAPSHSVTHAGAEVWFEYVDGNGSVYNVLQNGGPNRQLVIEVISAGITTFTVNMVANITPDQGNLASHSTNLVANSQNIEVTSAMSNLWGPTASAGANQINGFAPAGGGNILTAFGAGDFFFGLPTGDNLILGTISFRIDPSLGYGYDISIDGTIGNTLWAALDPPAPIDNVVFGDGSGVAGDVAGVYGGRFATIALVAPEPATLGLLGLGAVFLVRRGRGYTASRTRPDRHFHFRSGAARGFGSRTNGTPGGCLMSTAVQSSAAAGLWEDRY